MTDLTTALSLIKRGADELLVEGELIEKLKAGRPLRVKAGFDIGASHPLGERAGIYGAVGYTQALDSDESGVFVSGGHEGRVSDSVLIGASAEWSEASIAGARERTQATLYSSFALSEPCRSRRTRPLDCRMPLPMPAGVSG